MNLSGLVVACAPASLDACAAAVAALPGVEVHACDRDGARLVLVQEAADSGAQEEGLRRIQALPGVLHAALVYHYFDEGGAAPAAPEHVPPGGSQ